MTLIFPLAQPLVHCDPRILSLADFGDLTPLNVFQWVVYERGREYDQLWALNSFYHVYDGKP